MTVAELIKVAGGAVATALGLGKRVAGGTLKNQAAVQGALNVMRKLVAGKPLSVAESNILANLQKSPALLKKMPFMAAKGSPRAGGAIQAISGPKILPSEVPASWSARPDWKGMVTIT